MKITVVTLFPESFESYLNSSILGRAIEDKRIRVEFINPRQFAENSYRRIDQKPYGGGPGLVIEAGPVVKAVEKARGKKKIPIFFTAPQGTLFTQKTARTLSRLPEIIFVSGRYEGIDERARKIVKGKNISLGDFVLTGGELPVMVFIDAIARHIPGVLGKEESREESRIASSEVYTRPEVFVHKKKKYRVPKVLLSGNHKRIEEWRKKRMNTRIREKGKEGK